MKLYSSKRRGACARTSRIYILSSSSTGGLCESLVISTRNLRTRNPLFDLTRRVSYIDLISKQIYPPGAESFSHQFWRIVRQLNSDQTWPLTNKLSCSLFSIEGPFCPDPRPHERTNLEKKISFGRQIYSETKHPGLFSSLYYRWVPCVASSCGSWRPPSKRKDNIRSKSKKTFPGGVGKHPIANMISDLYKPPWSAIKHTHAHPQKFFLQIHNSLIRALPPFSLIQSFFSKPPPKPHTSPRSRGLVLENTSKNPYWGVH